MAGNSDSCDTSTSTDSMFVSGAPDDTLVLDDTFLILQRATTIVKNIYFDYYALSKADFLKNVEGLGNEMELRYARDMIHSIVKRRKRFSGQLAERKKCDGIKDKLSKDIYMLFSYGEGSLPAIPKNMLRNESKQYVDNTCQTNVLDESFVLKKDLDKVKCDLLEKINAIQSSLLNASSSALCSADTVDTVDTVKSLQPNVVPVPSTVSENNSEPRNPTSNVPVDERVTDVNQSINHSTEKIIFVGDSILHKMNPKKMKVGNVPSIKLTKPGDNRDGCVNRAHSFVSKNAGDSLHIVLLAGTNDLSRRKTQPINLMDNLIESLDELEKFTNVKSICLKGVTKFLHAFLMFAKPLILFGLTGCYTRFSQSLVLRGGCGWLSKTFILMWKLRFYMKGSFHENSVSLKEQDKAEFLLPSCIKFTLTVFCVSFQTIVFQYPFMGFVSPHPRLLMTSLYLHYILPFCRRSWIFVLIMVYDGDTNLIIQRVALSPSVKQKLSILFLWINAVGS